MIALVRRAQSWEFVGVSHPVEFSAIDDATTKCCRMSVKILGCRMRNDISTPFEWPAHDRSGEGVVDDQRNAMGMGCICELLDIEHRESRICYRLAEHGFGVGLESCIELFGGAVGAHERELDAHFGHRNCEKVICASIYRIGCDDVVACGSNVEDGEEVRGLAARCEHAGSATF